MLYLYFCGSQRLRSFFFFKKKKVTVMVSVDIVFVHMDIECEYVRFRTYLSCFFFVLSIYAFNCFIFREIILDLY